MVIAFSFHTTGKKIKDSKLRLSHARATEIRVSFNPYVRIPSLRTPPYMTHILPKTFINGHDPIYGTMVFLANIECCKNKDIPSQSILHDL